MNKFEVTNGIKYDVEDECISITKCICGYEDYLFVALRNDNEEELSYRPCKECGRRYVAEIRVYAVVEEETND